MQSTLAYLEVRGCKTPRTQFRANMQRIALPGVALALERRSPPPPTFGLGASCGLGSRTWEWGFRPPDSLMRSGRRRGPPRHRAGTAWRVGKPSLLLAGCISRLCMHAAAWRLCRTPFPPSRRRPLFCSYDAFAPSGPSLGGRHLTFVARRSPPRPAAA